MSGVFRFSLLAGWTEDANRRCHFGLQGRVMTVFHNSSDLFWTKWWIIKVKMKRISSCSSTVNDSIWSNLFECDVVDVASNIWEQKREQRVHSHKQMHIHIVSLWSSPPPPPPPTFFPFELQELKMAQAQNSQLFLDPCKEQDGCRGAEVYAQTPINTSAAYERANFAATHFPPVSSCFATNTEDKQGCLHC